jgi:hypothetical protein
MADTGSAHHDRVPFELGELLVTRAAVDAAVATGARLVDLLLRHLSCDWGTLHSDDQAANDHAVTNGGRIHSSYRLDDGFDIWVILTEADRSVTTVLLASEY